MTSMLAPALPATLMRIDSPIGRIELTGDGSAVTSLTIERGGRLPLDGVPDTPDDVLEAAARQLAEYFSGSRRDFDVPVRRHGTAFQEAIWQQIEMIPFGEVVSYGAMGLIATGRPAGRAVGGAVGANPVPIIVPCHRVLAGNGVITGYSAGEGIPTKKWLLDHEGISHK
jgi:methylated-DNA-[protein]-cysteine S-methyltransferase